MVTGKRTGSGAAGDWEDSFPPPDGCRPEEAAVPADAEEVPAVCGPLSPPARADGGEEAEPADDTEPAVAEDCPEAAGSEAVEAPADGEEEVPAEAEAADSVSAAKKYSPPPGGVSETTPSTAWASPAGEAALAAVS